MFDKADDELIQRLIAEAEAMIEEEIQKQLRAGQEGDADSDGKLIDRVFAQMSEDGESHPKKRTRRQPKQKTVQAEAGSHKDEEAVTPKRRGRPKKSAQTDSKPSNVEPMGDDESAKPKSQRKKPFAKSLTKEKQGGQMVVKEAILEFVEREDGVLSLQEMGNADEPMVTIAFSDQVKDMIGAEDIQLVGQSMIHAAIAAVMQRQMSAYHAHVHDEVPQRYS